MSRIIAAGELDWACTNHVIVTEWFCPDTTANLRVNKHISIVINYISKVQ